MLATVVETKELLETIGYSIVAGVGVALAYSIAVYGTTRFADLNRDERRLAAGAAALLAVVAFAAVLAGIVFGIIVMTTKS